jgi:hypothetical protein
MNSSPGIVALYQKFLNDLFISINNMVKLDFHSTGREFLPQLIGLGPYPVDFI